MAGFPWVELLLVCGRYLGTQLLAEARFRTHSSARRIRFVLCSWIPSEFVDSRTQRE